MKKEQVRAMSELLRLNVLFPERACWLLGTPYIASPPGQVSQAHYQNEGIYPEPLQEIAASVHVNARGETEAKQSDTDNEETDHR